MRLFQDNSCLVGGLCLFILSTSSCGTGLSGSSGGTFSTPTVATLVKSALPLSLQPGKLSTVSNLTLQERAILDLQRPEELSPISYLTINNANGSTAAAAIQNLFQVTFAGRTTAGYLMGIIAAVDTAMNSYNGASVSSHSCLGNTPKSYTVDLSAIDPMLKFTMPNIQCSAPNSGSTSGALFGQNGSNYSIMMVTATNFPSSGGFLSYANVTNYGSTSSANPQTVDGMSIEYIPSSRLTITRYKANPTANTFEMFYGSNSIDITTATSSAHMPLGLGYRMISNGTNIYADGTICTTSTACSTAGNLQAFNVCLNASTLAVDSTVSNCATLATSFTLNNTSAALTFTEITGDSTLTDAAGSGNPPTPVAPSTTAVSAITAVTASTVTNAGSVATTY